jgi:adenylyl-sulfate kinase
MADKNIHWHSGDVTGPERAAIKGQHPCVIWLTGLSASGKSTLANALERRLLAEGRHTMLLDADNIRHGLNRDLGFSTSDRIENIRRVGEVAGLMAEAGLIVITAFISPYQSDRDLVRGLVPAGRFIEVHLATPLAVCEQRDPKGLYRKARSGELPGFTGIDSPYEEPQQPELRLDTSAASVDECVAAIYGVLVGGALT